MHAKERLGQQSGGCQRKGCHASRLRLHVLIVHNNTYAVHWVGLGGTGSPQVDPCGIRIARLTSGDVTLHTSGQAASGTQCGGATVALVR